MGSKVGGFESVKPCKDSDVYSCRLSSFLTDYRKDLCLLTAYRLPLTAYRLPQGLNLTAACRLPQLTAGFNGFPWISQNATLFRRNSVGMPFETRKGRS